MHKKSIQMLVEIPKGSSDKYEYNSVTKKLELDRVLPVAMYYPEKYGFIPETLALDGDTLDCLCLTENPGGAGNYVEARIIGVLRMIDNGEQDDKLLVVDIDEPELNFIQSLEDIPEARKNKVIHFFSHYKDLDNKKVEVGEFEGKEQAEKLLKKCQELYKKYQDLVKKGPAGKKQLTEMLKEEQNQW